MTGVCCLISYCTIGNFGAGIFIGGRSHGQSPRREPGSYAGRLRIYKEDMLKYNAKMTETQQKKLLRHTVFNDYGKLIDPLN